MANLLGGGEADLPGKGSSNARSATCPRCRKEVAPGERWCVVCGLRLDSETATELVDLEATVRQLKRFEETGLLSQVMAGQMQAVVKIRRQRLDRKKPE